MELGNIIFGNSRGIYEVPRDDFEAIFYPFIEALNLDYGCHNAERDETNAVIDNDTFTIRPYYWGDDETIAALPNFVYKPTNFELQWYKYPLRDSYMNQDITKEQFKEIIDACIMHWNGTFVI